MFELFVVVEVCHPHNQFEVHHIVDDYGEVPDILLEVPTAERANDGVETTCQRLGTIAEHGHIGLVAGQTIAVTIAAKELEAYVVVGGYPLQWVEFKGVFLGQSLDFRVFGVLIDVPHRAGIETTAPPIDVGVYKTVTLESAGATSLGECGVHIFGVCCCHLHHLFGDLLHTLLPALRPHTRDGRKREDSQSADK